MECRRLLTSACPAAEHRAALSIRECLSLAVPSVLDNILGKKVVWINHRLELKGIPRWVLKKHCVLFSWLALEAQVWLDDKCNAFLPQPLGQGVKLSACERAAKVWHWHGITVNRVVMRLSTISLDQVSHHLVAKYIKIDPSLGTATLTAA